MASGRPGAGAPPPSFKTNVNRMKTKRWVEAKSYSYDGDDWGDADEYDEYDGYDDQPTASHPGQGGGLNAAYGHGPQPPNAPFAQQQARGGSPGRGQHSTDARERSGSFSRGDETRDFSGPPDSGSPVINPIHTAYGSGSVGVPPGGSRNIPQPAQPVHTGVGRSVPATADAEASPPIQAQAPPVNPSFAQRRDYPTLGSMQPGQSVSGGSLPGKSSTGQDVATQHQAAQSPSVQSSSISQPSTHQDSVLEVAEEPQASSPVFVRPADIYKRMMQEREKERPQQEPPRSGMTDPGVGERKSEYNAERLPSQAQAARAGPKDPNSPQLPELEPNSGFGFDFSSPFDDRPDTVRDVHRQSIIAAQEAAKRDVSQREADVAKHATELSHQPSQGFRSAVHQAFDAPVAETPAGSDIVRSDTTSTNAISPIISRNSSKPSDTGKGLATNMGSIEEEVSGHRHSLDPSSSNGGLTQTTPLQVVNRVPQTLNESPTTKSLSVEDVEKKRRDSAAKASAIQNVVETLSLQAQQSSAPKSSATRAESPTKGRVRDLVDKAESANSSRRGSQSSLQGVASSQEQADETRPQMPGGWTSYVTNTMTPDERSSRPSSRLEDSKPSSLVGPPINPSITGQGHGIQYTNLAEPESSRNSFDPEPTTEKRPLEARDVSRQSLDAARAAGAALAGSIAAAAGMGAGLQSSANNHGQTNQYGTGRAYNPDAMRPAMPPPADSMTSSILPTPKGYSPSQSSENLPADIPVVAPLRQRVGGGPSSADISTVSQSVPQNDRVTSIGSLGASSLDDENEKLSRDIVRQLSPDAAEDREVFMTPGPQELSPAAPMQTQLPDEAFGQASAGLPQQKLRHKFSWEMGGEQLNASETPSRTQTPVQSPPVAASTYKAPKSFGSILGTTSTISSASETRIMPPAEAQQTVPTAVAPAATQPKPFQNVPPSVSSQSQLPQVNLPSALITSTSPVIKPTETSVNNIQTQVINIAPESDSEQEDEPHESAPASPDERASMSPTSIAREPPRASYESTSTMAPPPQYVQPSEPTSQETRQSGQAPQPGQAPVLPFREILAMKNPQDRLRVYRNTQDTFYHMDTGLSNWIQAMGEKHPEHKGLLQSRGQFTTPTPGMPGPVRPPQSGSAAASSSTFGGLRKPGVAAAAPSMSEAGAALKSAGRDTKKLAKGLFAKGRSKFGRDKGLSSKIASPSRRPLATSAPSYQQQQQTSPAPVFQSSDVQQSPNPSNIQSPPSLLSPQSFQSPQLLQSPQSPTSAQVTGPDQSVQFPTQPREIEAHPPSRISESAAADGEVTALPPYSLIDAPVPSATLRSPPLPQPQSPKSEPEDPVILSFPTKPNREAVSADDDDVVLQKKLPPPPPIPDSADPEGKPGLKQRLTIHQKDMRPFEMSFPSDLFVPDKTKQGIVIDKARDMSGRMGSPPGSPPDKKQTITASTVMDEVGMSPNAQKSQFPVHKSSVAQNRTLDPGKATKVSHPSWLNFTPPMGTPTSIDLLSQAGSPAASPPLTSSPAFRSPQVRQSIQFPTTINTTNSMQIETAHPAPKSAGLIEEDRPFSFINFADTSDANFTLDEEAFQIDTTRRWSISEDHSDGDVSRPATRGGEEGEELEGQEDQGEGVVEGTGILDPTSSNKPLPDLPPPGSVTTEEFPSRPYASQTMPASQAPRPSLTLFPQTSPRIGTQGSIGADYGPPVARAGAGLAVGAGAGAGAASTMPTPGGRHKRSMSGGPSHFLQRALNNLPGPGLPKRDKNANEAVKGEKSERRRRRLSGLGLGNFLQQAKGQLKTVTAPLRSQNSSNQAHIQYRPYTPNESQGRDLAPQQPQSRPYTPNDGLAQDQVQTQVQVQSNLPHESQIDHQNGTLQSTQAAVQTDVKRDQPKTSDGTSYALPQNPLLDSSQRPATQEVTVPALSASSTDLETNPSGGFETTSLRSKFNPYQKSASETSSSLPGHNESRAAPAGSEIPISRAAQPIPSIPKSSQSGRDSTSNRDRSPGYDHKSLDLFPPPPGGMLSPDSPHTLQTPNSAHHKRTQSSTSISSRRSRAPSLSINTKVPSPNDSSSQIQNQGQNLSQKLRPEGQGASKSSSSREPSQDRGRERSRSRSNAPEAAATSSSGQASKAQFAQSQAASTGQQVASSRKRDLRTQHEDRAASRSVPVTAPAHDEETLNSDFDDVPSDLEDLPGFEPAPPSAKTVNSMLTTATPMTADDGPLPPLPPLPPIPGEDAGVRMGGSGNGNGNGNGNGKNNRITLTPAALRFVRQREIELGGETRLNSPSETPEDEKKRLGHSANIASLDAEIKETMKQSEETQKNEATEAEPEVPKQADEKKQQLSVPSQDEEVPIMSATSFPGQEWNPYEDGY